MAAFSLLPLLFFLLVFKPAASTTRPADVEALKSFKQSIDPSSIPPGSCLASWDFSVDPCDSAFSARFTCGLRCDLRLPASNHSAVTDLSLDPAGYSGRLSPSLWLLPDLLSLDLADNRLSGRVPPGPLPSSLRRLSLSRNLLSGPLPSLSPAPSLTELYLDGNQLSGPIPASLPPNLQRLELQMNNLTGPIPDLSHLPSLYFLDASDNGLSGGFPAALPPSLTELSLRSNRLAGAIPGPALARLPWLQVMDLSYNRLSGAVPAEAFAHPALEQLTLAHNRLDRVAQPADGGAGSRLVAVDLGHNRLSGWLPGSLGTMPRLTAVNLEDNRFTGMIPAQYAARAVGSGGTASMVPFGRMILSGNYLFGPIPGAMVGMKEGTAVVSLADNCLFRCPPALFFCAGGQQKPSATCRDFNPVIPQGTKQ